MSFEIRGTLVSFTPRTTNGGAQVADVVIHLPAYGQAQPKPLKIGVGNKKGMVDEIARWPTGCPVIFDVALESKQTDKGFWNTDAWAWNAWRLSKPAANELAPADPYGY